MSAIETTPLGTQVAILQSVLAERFPKHALGAIAARYSLTLVDLQAILHKHGYPDLQALERSAHFLAQDAAAQIRDDTTAAETTPGDPEDVDDEHKVGTLTRVPITKILTDPENPRDHLPDIEELADSIVEIGLLQPIVVRRDGRRLIVVAGHRRLAALKHLKHTDAPVIIRSEMRSDEVLAAMLIENGQRADLDPLEEARGLSQLKQQLGCTDTELARRVGRSGAHISNRLALLHLSPEEQAEVRAGNIGITQASQRGRLNAGKVMAPGATRDWHLSGTHTLGTQAKARCVRLGHKNGRKVGGMGCGECWESVIRADERTKLLSAYHDAGNCPTCGQVDASIQKVAG